MYISLFLLICAVVYIIHLHGKKEELRELQKTIALLQEQILLLAGIERRIDKLEKVGISITGLGSEHGDSKDEKKEKFKKILSRAYFSGWYQLSSAQREKLHSTREEVERKFPWL